MSVGPIEKFRELLLKVDERHSADFAKAANAALSNGWSRAYEEERRAEAMDSLRGEMFYFKCDQRANRQPALLAIYRRDAETLYVSNIVPSVSSELTYEQYNSTLQDFHDSVLSRIAPTFPITFLLGSDELRIEQMMQPQVFKLLKNFSELANRKTGSAHPMDRDRWFAFLAALASTPHRLDAHNLMRWLTEAQNWPEDTAHRLVVEFEFALGLLAFNRQPKRKKARK